MSSRSSSPPVKRAKIESISPKLQDEAEQLNEDVPDDLNEDHCTICLQEIVDRTMIPPCSHDAFCFDCLMIWTVLTLLEQSRRCPLCSQNIGDHVIHHYRSRFDYQKHFLPPLRTSSPKPLLPVANRPVARRSEPRRRIPREVRERSRREREEREAADRFDRALVKRKWVYRHDFYAKHVASNSYTRFRPFPTPAQFAASPDLISRTTTFLRRELLVWPDLDVEFLTTFIISLMKAIDIRSESAVKLLAEFLDLDAPYIEGRRHVNAEHFAHEVYTYVRSPYKDLFIYDTVVQYDESPDASPPRRQREARPPKYTSQERERRRRSRSHSWSPSGRSYPSSRAREMELGERNSQEGHRRGRSSAEIRESLNRPIPSPGVLLEGQRARGSSGAESHKRSRNPASAPQDNKRFSPSLQVVPSPATASAPTFPASFGPSGPQDTGRIDSDQTVSKGKRKAGIEELASEPDNHSALTFSDSGKRSSRLLDLRSSVQAHLLGDGKSLGNPSRPGLRIKGEAGRSSLFLTTPHNSTAGEELLIKERRTTSFAPAADDVAPASAPASAPLRIKGQGKSSSLSRPNSLPSSLLPRLSGAPEEKPITSAPFSTEKLSNTQDRDHQHFSEPPGDEYTKESNSVHSSGVPEPRNAGSSSSPSTTSDSLLSSDMTPLSGRYGTKNAQTEVGGYGARTTLKEIRSNNSNNLERKLSTSQQLETYSAIPEHIAPRATHTAQVENGPFTPERQMNGNELGSDSRPSSSNVQASSHISVTVSGVSTRLLLQNKLEAEKRQLHLGHTNSNSTESSFGRYLGIGVDDGDGDENSDAFVGMGREGPARSRALEAREVELRARARLGMRLASEKRNSVAREKS
ncbi:hypothetical protein GYMLUDRAFT_86214 [Collybiopsis luxurians FD-317 M1]|uniref:RING-type E3 ubiquitin transferase n=1 Tax=Collybiopsis luxurians FD-317 M1 TaxID=944289 RepID=A0A0D0CJM4_9AGAR|nr:hypothetical protein GYMLUDRAFT_86214 [Collybiopsis luxurians FD-317 M1]